MIEFADAQKVSIEPVDELPKRLRPHALDPVVDRIAQEVTSGSGWHRVATSDPAKLRARLKTREVKVEARQYQSDPLALFVRKP